MSDRRYTPEQDALIADMFLAGTPQAAIRREFGGSRTSVVHSLQRSGVYEIRLGGKPGRYKRWAEQEIDAMVKMWEAGETKSAISRNFGTKTHIVDRLLASRGIVVRRRTGRYAGSGSDHPSWKGGRVTRLGGGGTAYVAVRVADPTDTIAWPMRGSGGYVLEHRLVVARAVGRPLVKTETVHHINGDGLDNRLENLQLRQGRHGNGVILRCRSCGSHDIESAPIADHS